VKINKWETTALKNALDDACKKVEFRFEIIDRLWEMFGFSFLRKV